MSKAGQIAGTQKPKREDFKRKENSSSIVTKRAQSSKNLDPFHLYRRKRGRERERVGKVKQ